MKLGIVKHTLSLLLIASMFSSPTLASNLTSNHSITTSINVISQKSQLEEDPLLSAQERNFNFIKQYGYAAHASSIQDNLKVTVEYMLYDAYTVNFLISIQKLDGTPFKSQDNLHIQTINLNSKKEIEQQAAFDALPKDAPFIEQLKVMSQFDESLKAFIKDDNTVDMKGFITSIQNPENISTSSSTASYGMLHTSANTDSKIYFTYQGSYAEPLSEEIILSLESISEKEQKTEAIATDLVQYLTSHQNELLLTTPNPIEDNEKAYLEKLKQTNEARYLIEEKELQNRPKKLLTEKGLNLPLTDKDNTFVIDNIGFIDGKLHILILGNTPNRSHLEVYNQDNEWVNTSYQSGSNTTLEDGSTKRTKYYIYDIPSLKELSNYNFKLTSTETLETWQGPWKIPLNMNNRNQNIIISVNQPIFYTADTSFNLNEIHLGKASVALFLKQLEGDLDPKDIPIKLILKDGTEQVIDFHSASSSIDDQHILIYQLKDIPSEDIESIGIGSKNTLYYVHPSN